MPRSRGSEMHQRQSPRVPLQLRTSSSDSDPLHHRSVTDRSPKLGDRRSPRGAQSDPLNQRKLGTRIADLESQLGQAQDELKSLKGQLASAEAAKKAVQEQLEKKTKKPTVAEPEQIQETSNNNDNNNNNPTHEIPDDDQKETDVFEVPVEKVTLEPPPNVEISHPSIEEDLKSSNLSPAETPAIAKPVAEQEKSSVEELNLKDEEISSLKSKLEEKEKELQVFSQENEGLKKELNEKMLEISSVKAKEEETSLNLNQVTQELETSKNDAVNIQEKLEATEKAKEALENEMKKLRVQTEQWRKAADAAAAVLAGGVEMNGRRLSERCGSMDKHYGNVFEPAVGGYGSYMGSPGLVDDSDDVFGHGKRKGSGIKKFGDLWRKKGQK
ncbi:PREDICTED: interactor of constitutive active ROPs 1-like [Nicotiana attenuata]|uniref:Interactor of constitutive active rops 4 n=1 Tax=Nicotiana attenuata TaxID=49451 RepID=A0A1J6I6Z2_NICAT|nr:PREDICTED: interactor of constitutive active ROPs 1-like [Nicotiana attenuata]XP_019249584.1 PREDICTED: interactor of constitutive active ROPs 1-like [Nicotiana attenuata]XP_019249585.1 PREDICTED: interactor of constitutive active ROPs 1-like [Nicotiana attenuata]XP_019249586.1 PREDICTED: interactor of constitutive active ROPs 1-like [Nicotiana attenuata]XP_019249587.1 PREDICTED: interactor of constitutive active ROPs 1-like [Nicotiana attenuata]XP_019249588.1 PREDICTED: interactor of const